MTRLAAVATLSLFVLVAGVFTIAQVRGQSVYGRYGDQAPCYLPDYRGALPCAVKSPDDVVRHGLALMRQFQETRAAFVSPAGMRFLQKDIAPYFDFASMTEFALGTAKQRVRGGHEDRAIEILKQDFLGKMAGYLGRYDAAQLEIGPAYREAQGRIILPLWARRHDGGMIGVALHFHFVHGQWHIYDVVAGGRGALAYYRDTLGQLLSGR